MLSRNNGTSWTFIHLKHKKRHLIPQVFLLGLVVNCFLLHYKQQFTISFLNCPYLELYWIDCLV